MAASDVYVLRGCHSGYAGTGNFVGEFMILFGSFKVVPAITVISTFGLVFASVYSLAMLHRAYFGKAKSEIAAQELPGMSLRELFIILLLVVLLVLLGFFRSRFWIPRIPR
jgi:NADH-quinone oxidoreductase subunit M